MAGRAPDVAGTTSKPRGKRLGALGLVGLGSGLIGLVAGLLLGWFMPAVGPTSAATEVVVGQPAGEAVVSPLVPDVRGLTEADARQVLADHGLTEARVVVTPMAHVEAPGVVVRQEPAHGASLPALITLLVAQAGPMPDLVGKTEAEARTTAIAMGADPSVVRLYSPGLAVGRVVSSQPAAGEPLSAQMTLTVASPPASRPLAEIKQDGSCGSVDARLNGKAYPTSVGCDARSGRVQESVYLLNRQVGRLTASLGIDDRATPGARAAVTITGDGNQLFTGTAEYGGTVTVDADTAGVLRLVITVERVDAGTDSARAVLGDAALAGSAEGLASLESR